MTGLAGFSSTESGNGPVDEVLAVNECTVPDVKRQWKYKKNLYVAKYHDEAHKYTKLSHGRDLL